MTLGLLLGYTIIFGAGVTTVVCAWAVGGSDRRLRLGYASLGLMLVFVFLGCWAASRHDVDSRNARWCSTHTWAAPCSPKAW